MFESFHLLRSRTRFYCCNLPLLIIGTSCLEIYNKDKYCATIQANSSSTLSGRLPKTPFLSKHVPKKKKDGCTRVIYLPCYLRVIGTYMIAVLFRSDIRSGESLQDQVSFNLLASSSNPQPITMKPSCV